MVLPDWYALGRRRSSVLWIKDSDDADCSQLVLLKMPLKAVFISLVGLYQ